MCKWVAEGALYHNGVHVLYLNQQFAFTYGYNLF